MRKNIAILTMSLNIGGAETHIFELACALADIGHNVTVFSAGGVYVDKLREHGVSHITAPMDSKNPRCILRSYQIVSEYVKTNKPCVIHSHTRISNFIAHLISKRFNVPFVSTVHGIYKTGFGARLFSKWGTRALAVSEDRKEYVTNYYGFDANKVHLTVNGINLNTFKKAKDENFKKELGLENSKVILCVTRLDSDGCEHVYKLLESAQDIYKSEPDANIVIVGGGKKQQDLALLSEKINQKTKPDFIRLLGPQTDIYRYCNVADLFVGISRSALEAMACEVPTILLGNTGYIGLFSEKTKEACIDTNFTCRGFPYPDSSEFVSLVTDMLKNPDAYAENVRAGLDIVKTTYSVSKMAEDALLSYQQAENDLFPYDFMLCGYYGRHNLGDDISLCATVNNINNVCGTKRAVVLTANKKATPKIEGVKYVHRFNLFKIFSLMKKSKLFILGNGSILQDTTSSRSIFYYLFVLKKAINMCPRNMLYSNGIGPITKESHRKRAVQLLNRVMKIVVRDMYSYNYLLEMGVTSKNIELAADEVFSVDATVFEKISLLGDSKKYLCVNLRNLKLRGKFLNKFAKFIDTVSNEYNLVPVLAPVHYKQDKPALKRLSSKLKSEHIFISKKLTHESTLALLSDCEAAIVERLHAMVFSTIFQKPFIALNYDPKILSLCDEFEYNDYVVSAYDFNENEAKNKFDLMWKNKDEISKKFAEKTAKKRTLAKNNANAAKYLLK